MEIVNVCRAVVEPNEDLKKKTDRVEKASERILNGSTSNVQEKNGSRVDVAVDVDVSSTIAGDIDAGFIPKPKRTHGTSPWKHFSAEEFVANLLNEGSKTPCDDTSDSFNDHLKLPSFYDEELFKRGQDFFDRNIFGLFLSKLLGLIALLALPETVKILALTNMSSTPLSAYKRYVSTTFHMCLWYDENFKPGSSSWSSLIKVRNLHNSASRRSCSFLKYRISQKDMALTQLGFIGFGLVRGKFVGVHYATEEELKGFIHLWRIIGYVLGIEDRFNICRESVKETNEICNLLIEKVWRPALEKPAKEFGKMSRALASGLWMMNPAIEYNAFLCYLRIVVDNNDDISSQLHFKDLNFSAKVKVYFVFYLMLCMQLSIIRIIYNYIQYIALWLLVHFPFLAYYSFGKENSHVSIHR